LEIGNQRVGTVTSFCLPLCPFLCLPVSRLFWVSSLAYPNLLGTKGYVVVVVLAWNLPAFIVRLLLIGYHPPAFIVSLLLIGCS
jgi:hypothetical protein